MAGRFSRFDQFDISSVTFFLHLGFGNKTQRCTVYAISQSAAFFRTVVENVPQVCTSDSAAHLGAVHSVRCVVLFCQQMVINRLGESRPPAARFKLIRRQEKRFAGGYVDVNTLTKLIVLLVLIGSLGGCILRHLVLQGR